MDSRLGVGLDSESVGPPVQASFWDGDQECISCPQTLCVDGPAQRQPQNKGLPSCPSFLCPFLRTPPSSPDPKLSGLALVSSVSRMRVGSLGQSFTLGVAS